MTGSPRDKSNAKQQGVAAAATSFVVCLLLAELADSQSWLYFLAPIIADAGWSLFAAALLMCPRGTSHGAAARRSHPSTDAGRCGAATFR